MRDIKIPKLVGFLFLIAFIITFGVLIPYSLVLGKAGLGEPEIADQLSFYVNLYYFVIGIAVIYLGFYLWRKNNKYGESIGFFSIGEKPSLSFFKRFTAVQLALYGAIFSSSLFLIANSLKVFEDGFFGLKVLPQQFSPLDSLLFSAFILPAGENLMAGFSIAVIVLLMTLIAIYTKMRERDYRIYVYSVVTIGLAILGYIWHKTVYTGSDIAGFVTAIFWGLGGFISIASGYWILFWEFHLFNNFFIDFGRLYSSDVVFGATIGIILSLCAIAFIVYKGRLLGKKSSEG